MEFKFSVKGIPYIEFDQDTRLIFTKLRDDQKIYKWFSIVGGRQIVSIKRNGRTFREISERVDFITDATLSGFPRGFTKRTAFTRKHFTYIRKVFKNYLTDDGHIHEDSVPDIAKDISNFGVRKPREKKKIIKDDRIIKDDKFMKELIDEVMEEEKKPKKKKPKKKVKKAKHKLAKICKSCQREIFTVPSCNSQVVVGHGQRWMPVVHKSKEQCKHCGVLPGGRHHLYCPSEQCPRCNKKIIVCGCFY